MPAVKLRISRVVVPAYTATKLVGTDDHRVRLSFSLPPVLWNPPYHASPMSGHGCFVGPNSGVTQNQGFLIGREKEFLTDQEVWVWSTQNIIVHVAEEGDFP